MKILAGLELDQGDPRDCVLCIHHNIYSPKQAGHVWNHYLVNELINKLSFEQSKVDKYVFYQGRTMYVLYTDDSLIAGPDK